MGAKSNILSKKLKHVGYWNFKDTYNFCFDYLKDDLGYGLSEKMYEEKDTSGGKDIKVEWKATKKLTDYYKGVIELKWHIIAMNSVEVERDGKKEKTNKGELKLEFKAIMERDYEDKWEDTPFWKYMRGTYDKYIAKNLADDYEDQVEDDINELISQTKAYLQLQSA